MKKSTLERYLNRAAWFTLNRMQRYIPDEGDHKLTRRTLGTIRAYRKIKDPGYDKNDQR